MAKRVIILLIFSYAATSVIAQQDAQFSQYMLNTLWYNPGYAGVEGVTRLTASHRSQWLGYQPTINDGGVAPTTQLISMTTPIYKLNSGFGAHILNDRTGPLTNLEAQVSYAYHLALKDSKLSFGLRTGIYSQTIDFGVYRAIHPNDEKLAGKAGKTSQIKPDLSMGVFYRKEKYYFGLSFSHLTKAEFDFGVSQKSILTNHVYLTGGYYYDVSFDLRFLFTCLVQSDLTQTTATAGAIGYFKDKVWVGTAFRQADAATLLLGYSLVKDKSVKLNYAFDYVVQNQSAKQVTSHELVLTYELPVNPGGGKKVVRTPRYRH
jgi:type IX secretion system PorP/SprF family membrane protein